MQNQKLVKSILAADFGSVNTRLVLITLVEGEYRVAGYTQLRTTQSTPLNDVTIGFSHAVENLQLVTDRLLIDENEGSLIVPEKADGSGIDAFVATSSAGRPMQAVIVGLMKDISVASARRALMGSYVQATNALSIAEVENEEAQINAILRSKPDIIVISGGTDGGHTLFTKTIIEVVKLATRLVHPEDRPIVVYAGNQDLAEYVKSEIEDEQTNVIVAKNVRPALATEAPDGASRALAEAYSAFMSRQPGGFEVVADFSSVGLIPTAQSVTTVIRWLGERLESTDGVLHVDVGSTTSTLTIGTANDVQSVVRSELGVGHSLVTTIETLPLESIQRWLPYEISTEDMLIYAHNKALTPTTIPQSDGDLVLEQAIGRAIVRHMIEDVRRRWSILPDNGILPPFRPIILAGAVLTDAEDPAIAAMLALDALEIGGITMLYSDPFAVVSALGAVAFANPVVTVQAFEAMPLVYLGAVFCAEGNAPNQNKRAMRVHITLPNGDSLEQEIMGEDLWRISIPPGQSVVVDIQCSGGMKINGKNRLRQYKVTAGVAGLIFDTRGRPLPILPYAERSAAYARWRANLTLQPLGLWEHRFTQMMGEIETQSRRESGKERKAIEALMADAAKMKAFEEPDDEAFGLTAEEKPKRRRGRKKAAKQPRKQTPQATQDAEAEEEDFPDLSNVLDRL